MKCSSKPVVLAFFLVTLLSAGLTKAQPLPAACPNGGPNYAPFGIGEFLAGDVGTPMLRHTLTGTNAECNDGSPAIMYLRPSSAYYTGPRLPNPEQHPERWLIVFHGGGGCGSADQCLERWCGIPGFNRAGKMSTLGAFDATPGRRGIFKRNPALNRFAGYNQVLINYCSSDNYIGSESHVGLVPTAGPTYDIEFQGEAIVRDVFQTLVAGAAPDAGPALTFWNDVMPSLLTAEEIVLAGESAGGGGLRHHLDSIRQWLLTQMAPETRIVGVIDAGVPPALSGAAIDWTSLASPPVDYTDYLLTALEPRAHGFWGANASAIDQSCLNPAWAAAHNAVGSHPEICLDTTYTLFEHITTPVFVRQDINDTLARDRYTLWDLLPNLPTFWSEQFLQTNALPAFAGLEPPVVARGAFGPKCNQHVSMLSDDFFRHTITPVAGALSFHDLLDNWMNGALPSAQVQVDVLAGPAYSQSFCP